MPDSFTFGGITTTDYGLWVFRPTSHTIPSKPYELVSVPGKMGDVPIGGNKVNNETISYTCIAVPSALGYGNYQTYAEAMSAFRNAMLSTKGYRRLTDTFDAIHYREACYAGPTEVVDRRDYVMGKFAIEFTAKPQRYIDLDDISVASDTTKTLTLTEFPADIMNLEPIITVTGTGTITFSDIDDNVLKTITITQNPGTVVVNSQLKECYSGSDSANGWVQFNDYQFPVFGPFYGYAGQVKVVTSGVSLVIDPGGYEL